MPTPRFRRRERLLLKSLLKVHGLFADALQYEQAIDARESEQVNQILSGLDRRGVTDRELRSGIVARFHADQKKERDKRRVDFLQRINREASKCRRRAQAIQREDISAVWFSMASAQLLNGAEQLLAQVQRAGPDQKSKWLKSLSEDIEEIFNVARG